jgi:collagenase-like PrtC family protease
MLKILLDNNKPARRDRRASFFSNRITFNDKLKIKSSIFRQVDEQKIDMIIAQDDKDPFVRT